MKKDRLDYLAQLKDYGMKKNIPNISEENARFLHFLVQLKKASSVLEIGTANGYSTLWLADAIADTPHPRYLGIEISLPSYNAVLKNIQAQNLDHFVEIRFGNALEILPQVQETFDVLFVDGQKALYTEFWKALQPLLKPDSLIIFDDMIQFPEKTHAFWEMIQADTKYKHLLIPTDHNDGILLIQRH